MGNDQSHQQENQTPPFVKDYKTWSLFVCNAYLIPPFTVNKDNATCQHQDERAAALGRVITKSKPDIVMLQEAWGAGLGALEQNITPSHYSVGKFCRSWFGSTVVDSLLQYANSRGGLYFAHCLTQCANTNRKTGDANDALAWRSYSFSNTKSKKGMCCVKYQKLAPKADATAAQAQGEEVDQSRRAFSNKTQNPNQQSVSTLLVFNTHLDPTNQNNAQLKQLRELGIFIRDVITEERTSNKDNNTNFGAVLVGDFNFQASDSQYKEMWKLFKEHGSVDLKELLPASSQAVHTYAAKNPLVQWSSSAGRIDHIFAISKVNDVAVNDVELVQEKVREDVVVSDHYPFEAVVRVN